MPSKPRETKRSLNVSGSFGNAVPLEHRDGQNPALFHKHSRFPLFGFSQGSLRVSVNLIYLPRGLLSELLKNLLHRFQI